MPRRRPERNELGVRRHVVRLVDGVRVADGIDEGGCLVRGGLRLDLLVEGLKGGRPDILGLNLIDGALLGIDSLIHEGDPPGYRPGTG